LHNRCPFSINESRAHFYAFYSIFLQITVVFLAIIDGGQARQKDWRVNLPLTHESGAPSASADACPPWVGWLWRDMMVDRMAGQEGKISIEAVEC